MLHKILRTIAAFQPRGPRNERGATAVEYAIMAGFIAAVVALSVGMLGVGVNGLLLKGLAGFP